MEVKCVVVRHRLHRLHRRRSCQNRRNRASTSIRPAFTPSSPHYFFHSFLHSLLPSSSSPPSSPHLPFPFFPQSILTSIHYSAKTCMAEGSSTPSIFLIPSFLCPPFPLSLLPLYFIAASLFPNVLLFFLSPHSLPPSFLLHLPPPLTHSLLRFFLRSLIPHSCPPSFPHSLHPAVLLSFILSMLLYGGWGWPQPTRRTTNVSFPPLSIRCLLPSFLPVFPTSPRSLLSFSLLSCISILPSFQHCFFPSSFIASPRPSPSFFSPSLLEGPTDGGQGVARCPCPSVGRDPPAT